MLTIVYNDIEKSGLTPNSHCAEGWRCLIFKKNDRKNVANYRPITLLTCEYKIVTKALAIRLAETVPSIIHKDQAGFIPGRSIFDQTKLIETLINHAEFEEINGAIVTLDQEKVYDKIQHGYLWQALDKANFPQHFTKIIKTLYGDAYTIVVVNGEQSTRYKVTRGVRQGDPISCLLFNIAIEPLANMIRNSELTGFRCLGREDRIITALFADNTTVCLSETDKYQDLVGILTTWCTASGAKFNGGKTKIIPIGTKTHRSRMVLTRRISPTHATLPDGIEVVKYKSSIRILGGWFGNDVDDASVWAPTIEKI
jgi:hypothetical protein